MNFIIPRSLSGFNLAPYAESKLFWLLSFFTFEVVTYIFFDRILRSFKVGNYKDKYVLVTGCDSGFGRELTIKLDHLGFTVFAGCLTEEGRQFISQVCSKRVVPFLLDISKNESIQSAVVLVKQKIPANTGLWGLVNNAGCIGNPSPSEFCTREDFQKVFNVNLFGMAEMCRHFLPLVRKAKGRVVNMASVTGRVAVILPPYTTSKFGIEAYSDILRRELYYHDVKVSIIESGAFLTPLVNEKLALTYTKESYDRAPEDVKQAYGNIVDKMKAFIQKLTQNSSTKTYQVVNAYVHSLTSRYPRTRYTLGVDLQYFYLPLSYLPTRFSDWLLQFI